MKLTNAKQNRTFKLSLLAVLCALAVAVSQIESIVPVFAGILPGLKPGFSNIVTMFISCCLGLAPAIAVVVVKSGFVALTRGFVAFVMSLFGGMLSTIVTYMLLRCTEVSRFRYVFVGIAGATVHNFAQILVAAAIVGRSALYYVPALCVFSAVTGMLTGATFNAILPMLRRFCRGGQ